jgi:hypothetical protein
MVNVLLAGSELVRAEDSINPGLDSTLNHVKYESFLSSASSTRQVAEKSRLLSSLVRPKNEYEFTNTHPRYHILWALYGFFRHRVRYQDSINEWKQLFQELPERHLKVNAATCTNIPS